MSEELKKWPDERIKELLEDMYTLQEFGVEGLKLRKEGPIKNE